MTQVTFNVARGVEAAVAEAVLKVIDGVTSISDGTVACETADAVAAVKLAIKQNPAVFERKGHDRPPAAKSAPGTKHPKHRRGERVKSVAPTDQPECFEERVPLPRGIFIPYQPEVVQRRERIVNCYAATIFNVPPAATNKDVCDAFAPSKDILSVQRVDDIALLYFTSADAVQRAILAMNGKSLKGNIVCVSASGVVRVSVPV